MRYDKRLIYSDAGNHIASGQGAAYVTFNPPGNVGNSNDWVLVFDVTEEPEPIPSYADTQITRVLIHCDVLVGSVFLRSR